MGSSFIDFVEEREKEIKKQEEEELKNGFDKENEETIFVSTKVSNKLSFNYSDPSKTKEEKIVEEKRRRYQTYKKLEYMLSAVTYFDFYSPTAVTIALHSKFLAQCCGRKIASSELLLLPFLAEDSSIAKLLNSFDLHESSIGEYICEFNRFSERSFIDNQIAKFKFFFHDLKDEFFLKDFSLSSEVKNSRELNAIFEKSAENAFFRFKTPVVTSEILFLTMLEEKHTRVGKIIQTFIKNESDWYLLRYKLLKLIHADETSLRSNLKKSQLYFGYLLKTQLEESKFKTMLQNKAFSERVSIFRNKIIREVLDYDFREKFYKDVTRSIRLNNKRKYSI